ncbi:DUF932 domain-containing protein [Nonomuraea angiospora]|uniref:DUF932 domain-containing protein n=1 Tax=Nonomuraea angiospora TaxID=46172 RepID=UPI00344CD640
MRQRTEVGGGTGSALDRIAEARRTLGLTVEYYQEWAAEETLLAQTEIAMRDFEQFVTDLWPLKDDAPQRTRNAAARRSEQRGQMYRAETERLGTHHLPCRAHYHRLPRARRSSAGWSGSAGTSSCSAARSSDPYPWAGALDVLRSIRGGH